MNKECILNEKIIEKEKTVDIIKKQLDEIEKEINTCHQEKKKYKKNIKLGLLAVIGAMIGIDFLFYLVRPDLYVIENIKNIIEGTIFGGGFVSLYPALDYLMYKYFTKKLETNEFIAYFLEKKLVEEQANLQDLHLSNQKMNSIHEPNITQENDRQRLENLKDYFEKLRIYGDDIKKQADCYAHGFWETEKKEQIAKDGIDTELFADYLNQYNTHKLMKEKRAS